MASLATGTGHQRSIVWKFFELSKNDEAKVVCKLCEVSLSRGGKEGKTFNTTNLRKHLHSKQLEKEELLVSEENKRLEQKRKLHESQPDKRHKSPGSCSSSDTQITLEQTVELKKIWDINTAQSQIIHYAIGEMIAVDCQPYSIVEDVGFSRLMKTLKPNYQLPSRKYFSEKIVPSIHARVFEKVMATVNEAENISFTTDIWTSNSKISFISLTAHCLNANFEQKTVVLRVMPFHGSHTAAHISEVLQDALQE